MVAKSRKRKTEEAGAAQPARSPMPNWTISVRDFGRVASAEIEMAPMVVLVGKNNTGKSYMASLLWAMMNADEFLFRGLLPIVRGKTTVTLAAKLLKLAEDGDFSSINQEKPTGHSVFKNVHLLLNDALEERKNDIFEKLFSYQMNVGAINVSFKNGMDFQFPIVSVPAHGVTHVRFKDEAFGGFELSILDEKYNRSASWILASVLSVMLTGSHNQNAIKKPVYFPAARTGLMLAYHSITARLFEGLGGEEDKPRTRLPLPVVRFLQCFTDLYTDSPGKLSPIVAALENELIQGRVDASKDPIPSFWYEPDLLKTKLPLHATSSMITELAPFLLLLKNGFSENGLVFEEPEAHLHISAQRTLARLLVRIMNAGTRVVITTHSDTFIQQLNNLMQLHAHPKRDVLMKKFGYTAEDLLDPAMVKGYEFNPTKNGKTVVTPTKMNPGGLVVPSLNETLIDLAKELRVLQSD